ILDRIRRFNREREWDQFHTPKNLAIALTVEAAEVLEIFRWLTPEESTQLPSPVADKLNQEIGDVLICLLNLADKFNIDVVAAAGNKLELNEKNYPVEKAKGNAHKWTKHC